MGIDSYKKAGEEIRKLFINCPSLAKERYHNLLIIYAQDGWLAREKFYGNNMRTKGKILYDIEFDLWITHHS